MGLQERRVPTSKSHAPRGRTTKRMHTTPKLPMNKKQWKRIITSVLLVVLVIGGTVGLYFFMRFENLMNSVSSQPNTNAVDDLSRDPFAVMLLGAGTNGEDGEGAADSITLFVVNPAARVARIISVPRDSYLPRGASCEAAGYFDKIANSGNDVRCLQDTLSEVFDLEINYYMSINFVSFVNIVNTLGGVEMDVPDLREGFANWKGNASDGTYLSPYSELRTGLQWCDHDSARNPYAVCFDQFGKNVVDGEHALALARSRHYDSDFSRSARQSELIRAIANKIINNFDVFAIDKLISATEGNLESNIPKNQYFDFATLGQKMMSSKSGFSIQSLQLDGASSTFQGELYYASFNQVSRFSIEHIRYQIAKTFSPADFPHVSIEGFYHDPGERAISEFGSKYETYNRLGFLLETMDVQDPTDVKKYNMKSPYVTTSRRLSDDD